MEKNEKKLFTNEESNNIIRKKYNPLKSNYEREGLFMKETKDVILEEIGEKLNFIERIFLKKKYIRIYNKARITTINKLLK